MLYFPIQLTIEQLQNESVEYHPEFKPPPEGSSTGVKGEERLVEVTDFAHDKEQLQTRLTNFQENWPKLEKFYKKFCRLETVDVSLPAESVGLELESIMDDTMDRVKFYFKLYSQIVLKSLIPPDTEKRSI